MPSEYVQKLVPYLALRDATAPRWGNVLPCVDITPWGAGMCVRVTVATAYRKYCESTPIQLVSRRGRQVLMSGEDVEVCYVACSLGFGVGVFPSLKIIHIISQERISVEYLLGIFEGTFISNWILAYKWRGISPFAHSVPRKLLSLCKQTLLLRGIDRRMYFAGLRAAASAKRFIAASKLSRAAALETEANGVVEA